MEDAGTERPERTGEDGERFGRERGPMVVAVLGILTGGLYLWYWLWVTSKDIHRFDRQRKSPYSLIRWALPTSILAGIGLWVVVLWMFSSLRAAMLDPTAGFVGLGVQFFAAIGLTTALAFVGGIGVLVAEWRILRFVERHERAIGVRDPLSPGKLVAILLGCRTECA